MVSAVKGYERKEQDRKLEKKKKYRHGKYTAAERARKKLMDNVARFKNNKTKKGGAK